MDFSSVEVTYLVREILKPVWVMLKGTFYCRQRFWRPISQVPCPAPQSPIPTGHILGIVTCFFGQLEHALFWKLHLLFVYKGEPCLEMAAGSQMQ